MLLKSQRNELFRILEGEGLNPAHFETNYIDSMETTRLHYRGDPYSFNITTSSATGYYSALGFPPITLSSASLYNWGLITDHFAGWALTVKNELEEPDLWADVAANAKLFSNGIAPDEKFTNTEIRELQGQIRALNQRLDESTLPTAAKTALKVTVEEAPAKAERFTKKEWQGWFLGAIVSQVTNLTLTQEHVNTVYQLLKSTFSALLLK